MKLLLNIKNEDVLNYCEARKILDKVRRYDFIDVSVGSKDLFVLSKNSEIGYHHITTSECEKTYYCVVNVNNKTNIDELIQKAVSFNTTTDKPSQDKTWKKYYLNQKEIRKEDLPSMTLFDYIQLKNINYADRVAINYFDRKITYSSLMENSYLAAKAFRNLGVKENDIVTFLMPTTPETIYSIYGLNIIGAVANLVDLRTNESRIEKYIEDANSKYLVVLDLVYPKVKEIINKNNISNAIILSVSNSMPLVTNVGYKLKMMNKSTPSIKEDSKTIFWDTFIKNSKNYNGPLYGKYEPNQTVAIVYTGGTTGIPKGAMLTNENVIAMIENYKSSGIKIGNYEKFLDIMPPFIAYGFVNGINLPFGCSQQNVIIPSLDVDKLPNIFLKYKPSYFMGVPNHFKSLMNSDLMTNYNFSNLLVPAVGGDEMNTELENNINTFIRGHKGKENVIKGYGMTELSSAAITGTNNTNNLLSSVGIPLPMNDIKILNPDTLQEVSYDEVGELFLTGPTVFKGYLNNQSETDKVIYIDKNNTRWIGTRDLFSINKEGVLFFKGRLKNIIVRPDGHNVFPKAVESVISTHPCVKECHVIGIKSKYYDQGEIPTAFIVLKDNTNMTNEDIIKQIDTLCKEQMPHRDIALDYKIIVDVPYTSIGKVDLLKIKHEEEENKEKQKTYKKIII